MVEKSSDYVLRRGLGVRGSHYLNDGKKDFGFHHSALGAKKVPQSAPLSTTNSTIGCSHDIILINPKVFSFS